MVGGASGVGGGEYVRLAHLYRSHPIPRFYNLYHATSEGQKCRLVVSPGTVLLKAQF